MLYDSLDRLMATNAPNQWWIKETDFYDALDNITSHQLGNTTAYKNTYTYDPATWRVTGITGHVTWTLGYDANGNVTSKGNGNDSYVFDVANRLQSVTGKESYQYDGYGRRVKVTDAANGTADYPFYTAAGQLLTDDDYRVSTRTDYVSLNGSEVGKRSTPIPGAATWTVLYEHTDSLHSAEHETDASGNPTIHGTTLFTPYGEPGDAGKTYVQGPGFTGHVTDKLTGLTYAQQRYYDPVMGRFLSTDPVQADDKGGGFNRYWYANNNPYTLFDPDGREFDVVVNDNTAITGTHSGGFRGGRGKGNNWIYDPWGDFGKTKDKNVRMVTGVIAGDDAVLSDYIKFQHRDGPKVYLFRFATTPKEEDEIMEKIEGPLGHDGDGVGESGILPSCTIDLTTVLTGIGPFKNLKVVRTPRALLKQMLELKHDGKTIDDKKKNPQESPPPPPPPKPWFRASSWGAG